MGILMALLILFSWSGHLFFTLQNQPIALQDPWFWIHLVIQIWLFTGLFITAHDAMHGTVSKSKIMNSFLGVTSSMLYAGLWYPMLKKKHYLHHQHPASAQDPDYSVTNQYFLVWWYRFMKQYITIWQLLIMASLFNLGLLWFNEQQLIVFWIIPAILSTFQLFYFGTYRPHRMPHDTISEPHFSRSQKRNHLWAMISCYFFGYHLEHHASPGTPWWQLHRIKR